MEIFTTPAECGYEAKIFLEEVIKKGTEKLLIVVGKQIEEDLSLNKINPNLNTLPDLTPIHECKKPGWKRPYKFHK